MIDISESTEKIIKEFSEKHHADFSNLIEKLSKICPPEQFVSLVCSFQCSFIQLYLSVPASFLKKETGNFAIDKLNKTTLKLLKDRCIEIVCDELDENNGENNHGN